MEHEDKSDIIPIEIVEPARGIPFEIVIRALYGVSVLKFDMSSSRNLAVFEAVRSAARMAGFRANESPIIRRRPNEAGIAMEPHVLTALNEHGLQAAAPRARSGKGKSMGYPDIRIETEGPPMFLEVKTYAPTNRKSKQRAFFLSPTNDPKVFEDGFHLLVGFEMIRSGSQFTPASFELVDLHGLECDMKAEFNSNNERLYDEGRVLAREALHDN